VEQIDEHLAMAICSEECQHTLETGGGPLRRHKAPRLAFVPLQRHRLELDTTRSGGGQPRPVAEAASSPGATATDPADQRDAQDGLGMKKRPHTRHASMAGDRDSPQGR
jgi:hypothetical protein